MDITPKELFTALSHDTRLRCIVLLSTYEELCVCELIQAIGAPQPHISRHLAHLREVGLVSDRREGLWIHYRINPELPSWVSTLIEHTAQGVADLSPYDRDGAVLSGGVREPRCA